jgi:predicted nucleic acid-binding protein
MSDRAEALLFEDTLVAPEFLMVECANVLHSRARRGMMTRDEARGALAQLMAVPVQLRPAASHIAVAQSLAFDLDQTVYDALYLAVALAERATLVTADRAFVAAVARHGLYASSVRLLGAA